MNVLEWYDIVNELETHKAVVMYLRVFSSGDWIQWSRKWTIYGPIFIRHFSRILEQINPEPLWHCQSVHFMSSLTCPCCTFLMSHTNLRFQHDLY